MLEAAGAKHGAGVAAARIARDASFVLKNILTICNVSCVRTKEVV